MDKNAEVLARIIAEMSQGLADSRKVQQIAGKIASGTATYADALEYAQENGRIMTGSMKKNLPEVLTDGHLYRETAETVVRVPMETGASQVIDIAAEVQGVLNTRAGIGMNAIEPEVNSDQIEGIITGICNADSYEKGSDELFSGIENFLEGTVDDCVRENADFQYYAGMDPKVVRSTTGKCCPWCSDLAGTYDYADVSDKGNDVWRRHRNCHCVVEYYPQGNSRRRQNAHTKRWTDGDKADRITYEQQKKGLEPLERGWLERQRFGKNWGEGSLQGTIDKYVPGAAAESTEDGRKACYVGERYTVQYDYGGDYFRIFENQDTSKRRFLTIDGEKVQNIVENGKQRGASKSEYEALTHFRNTDSKRRK